MRIVVDTNIIISAIYFGGLPRTLFEMFEKGNFEVVASHSILEEYEEVIHRMQKKSKARDPEEIAHFIRVLTEKSIFIQPRHRKKYSRDPDDDKFIHCAQSGKAFYIVSGDSDLLDLDKIDDIEIVTAREFLNRVQGP